MSQTPNSNYRKAIVHGLLLALTLALIGYIVGYALYFLALQNYILFSISNVTTNPAVTHTVQSNMAGATLFPYGLAFVFGGIGLAMGLYRELE